MLAVRKISGRPSFSNPLNLAGKDEYNIDIMISRKVSTPIKSKSGNAEVVPQNGIDSLVSTLDMSSIEELDPSLGKPQKFRFIFF